MHEASGCVKVYCYDMLNLIASVESKDTVLSVTLPLCRTGYLCSESPQISLHDVRSQLVKFDNLTYFEALLDRAAFTSLAESSKA